MANIKITDLTALATIQTGDVFAIVDINDTSQAPSGSTRKLTIDTLEAYLNANLSFLSSGDNVSTLVNDAGYLTTETDPVFTASPASNVIDSGGGTLFLADDGTYKSAGGDSIYTASSFIGADRVVTLDDNATTGHSLTFNNKNDVSLFSLDGENGIWTLGEGATTGTASTFDGNVTIGKGATTSSTADLIAIGRDAVATGAGSMAIGFSTATNSSSTAIGYDASATQTSSTALGHQASANGLNATAIGKSATANFQYGVAMGISASSTGTGAIAIGRIANSVVGGVAIGYQAGVTGSGYANAIGYQMTNSVTRSTSLGSLGIVHAFFGQTADSYMGITSDVGIGITTPSAKLHVGGNTQIDGELELNATTSTSATAGANGDVPAQVQGYIQISISGTAYKVPYYNA